LLAAGKLATGAELASSAAAEAKKIAWAPLEAEALALSGEAQDESDPKAAEAALRDAAMLAGKAKDDRLLAEILTELIHVMGAVQVRRAEALAMETAAASAVERAGGDPLLRAKLLERVSNAL